GQALRGAPVPGAVAGRLLGRLGGVAGGRGAGDHPGLLAGGDQVVVPLGQLLDVGRGLGALGAGRGTSPGSWGRLRSTSRRAFSAASARCLASRNSMRCCWDTYWPSGSTGGAARAHLTSRGTSPRGWRHRG